VLAGCVDTLPEQTAAQYCKPVLGVLQSPSSCSCDKKARMLLPLLLLLLLLLLLSLNFYKITDSVTADV
jgi:hypothetical protein